MKLQHFDEQFMTPIMELLLFIYYNEGTTLTFCAQYLKRQLSLVRRLLNKLENSGLIEKKLSQKDNRIKLIYTSIEGKELARQLELYASKINQMKIQY